MRLTRRDANRVRRWAAMDAHARIGTMFGARPTEPPEVVVISDDESEDDERRSRDEELQRRLREAPRWSASFGRGKSISCGECKLSDESARSSRRDGSDENKRSRSAALC